MNKVSKYPDEEILKILKESKSFSDVVRSFGYKSINTGSYNTVKNELFRRNIEIPEYNYYGNGGIQNRLDDSEVFIRNSNYPRHKLKERLIKNKMIPYICNKCGNIGDWEGERLVLQLEHKNGINNDNRIENLCFLCPNCHSQSESFSGKNTNRKKRKNYCECGKSIDVSAKRCQKCNAKYNRKVERPSYEKLLLEIKNTSHNNVANKYGVSWRTIKKWLIAYKSTT